MAIQRNYRRPADLNDDEERVVWRKQLSDTRRLREKINADGTAYDYTLPEWTEILEENRMGDSMIQYVLTFERPEQRRDFTRRVKDNEFSNVHLGALPKDRININDQTFMADNNTGARTLEKSTKVAEAAQRNNQASSSTNATKPNAAPLRVNTGDLPSAQAFVNGRRYITANVADEIVARHYAGLAEQTREPTQESCLGPLGPPVQGYEYLSGAMRPRYQGD